MQKAGINPDVNTYNSLIAGASKTNLLSTSVVLFEDMLHIRKLQTGKEILEELRESGHKPNAITYNTVIRSKQHEKRLDIVSEMRSKHNH
ncbi:hypothetical protein FEM48_Zijuj08G0084000 [Ziziphus jujuba var. spinosa]|uniref:Uncharacterized protein n=1 Tax=Ziziphus jujuba var. spinosa TaxID=714518 RepID=A0A978UY12_ZIZJJ|nr:hypothetical protein FEM48_Zijuj08G0084000 [Ziziphus jujuba var. spinosa]